MAASLYKNYMRICEKWTVDHSKRGRDLGEFIRNQVFKEFSHGEASHIKDLKDCEKKMISLNRLVNNYYGNKYKRESPVTASGLSLQQCQEVMSTESLETLKTKQLGIVQRIKLQFQKELK